MKRPVVLLTAAAVACLTLSVVATSLAWGGFGAFLKSIDSGDLPLFMDFGGHYYPTARDLLATAKPADGFYYPAAFALLIVPLTWLPDGVALLAWGVLQVAAALALLLTSGLLLWPHGRAYAFGALAVTVASQPFWHSYRWGQVSVGVTALLLGALLARRSRRWLGPVLVALAAAIKVFPAVFALRWLARREYLAVTRFATAAVLALVIAPALVLGPARAWDFTEQTRLAARRAVETWVPRDVNSQYLPFVVARWREPENANERSPAPPREVPGLRVLGWLLFLANLAAAWRRLALGDEDELLAAGLLFTALPFALPTSWPHYFVFLPVCQVTALAYAAREPRPVLRWTATALAAVSCFGVTLPAFALAGGHPGYARLGVLCLANVALAAALQLLAAVTPVSRGAEVTTAPARDLLRAPGRRSKRGRRRRANPSASSPAPRSRGAAL